MRLWSCPVTGGVEAGRFVRIVNRTDEPAAGSVAGKTQLEEKTEEDSSYLFQTERGGQRSMPAAQLPPLTCLDSETSSFDLS